MAASKESRRSAHLPAADTRNGADSAYPFALDQANAGPPDRLPVSVVIPAFREEASVRAQVAAIRNVLIAQGIPHEILVVDDGSDDATAAEALMAGARVLRHTTNRGYGAALKTGIRLARFNQIVICDADGTYPAEAIPALLAQLAEADMAVGARTGADVHIPFVRRPAKWLLGRLAVHVAGQAIPDLNSGLRAFRRDVVQQYFPVLSNRFSFTTTVTLAYMADDYHVVYHPINYYERIGRSKITPRHFMDFVILVLRMAMLFQPLKVFVPLAFFVGGLGMAKVIYDIASFSLRTGALNWSFLYQPVLSTSAILLLLVALQFVLIGMLADGIVRRIALRNEPLVSARGIQACVLEAPEPAVETVLRGER
jgi:glycosyltransferase involved in cell wall biosynthesis